MRTILGCCVLASMLSGIRAPQTPPAAEPALAQILAKAQAYVAAYTAALSAIVAEERYEQRLALARPLGRNTRDEPMTGRRVTRSDFLLVRVPGENRWLPFRDVFEVDGVPVRDRDERLQKLFLEAPATAFARAARISDESARYNLGEIVRTINLPVMPLRFLEPANAWRFAFASRGPETIEGSQTCRVEFRETARPTLVKSGRERNASDVPADGSFWIDPTIGRVVKTHLRLQAGQATMDTTVVYRPADKLDVWVPSEMRERYEYPRNTITGVATYSNVRRFQVTTEERLKDPT